ncbi:tyrosine-protein phosphatase [Glutamicibacter arilaitensis]|uniref:tyrosine-protein phosphatase n=1 Tax=Glutamicibacter arilaitensis TaxID=256701 RepID=UPI00384F80EF
MSVKNYPTALPNLREAGGIPAAGGKIRAGVLYRSAVPHLVDETLSGWLGNQGITQIFDLRSTVECSRLPGFPATLDGTTSTRLPLLEGAFAVPGTLPSLEELYLPLVAEHGQVWAKIAGAVAESPKATLVHCTAGKDRTGVAIALLLLAVGAEREAVLADYAASTVALSGAWLDSMRTMLAEHGGEMTQELRHLMVGTSVAGLERALDLAIAQHGSILDYLLAHGLSGQQFELLGARLVETR